MTSATSATSARRLARTDSKTRTLMLEAAAAVLTEEGYAMLTSRRIANRIGVKQQLVFYYFKTMDDLAVETFRWLAKRELKRAVTALQAEHPVHEIWNVCINASDARQVAEFIALAHRNERLRAEVSAHIERMREVHVQALTRAAEKRKHEGLAALPPEAISFLAWSAALSLGRESAIGVSHGHAETIDLVGQYMAALEPDAPAPKPKSRGRRPRP